ncbi:MAG: SprB repeat-containing protein, partial [Saprospiraceae bacterium]
MGSARMRLRRASTAASSLNSIDLTGSGGTRSYPYSWSNGATIADLTNLSAGTYTVTVTDAIGCSQTTSETVTAPAELFLQFTATPVSCAGGNNGSIELTITGGMAPYNYGWSNLAGSTNPQDQSNLSAGTY